MTMKDQHQRDHEQEKSISLKVATTAILAALGVVLSYLNPFGYFTIFGAKINPFAHFINGISGVLLGPIYAVFCALLIAIIRFSTGIGTILAFPGGMTGAFVVGIFQYALKNRDEIKTHWAALCEPLGTVFLGATISSLIIPTSAPVLMWLFALSCVPGAIMGWGVVKILDAKGYLNYFQKVNPQRILNQNNQNGAVQLENQETS